MCAAIADLRFRIDKARETLNINATPNIEIVEETAKEAKLKELDDMKAKLRGFKK